MASHPASLTSKRLILLSESSLARAKSTSSDVECCFRVSASAHDARYLRERHLKTAYRCSGPGIVELKGIVTELSSWKVHVYKYSLYLNMFQLHNVIEFCEG